MACEGMGTLASLTRIYLRRVSAINSYSCHFVKPLCGLELSHLIWYLDFHLARKELCVCGRELVSLVQEPGTQVAKLTPIPWVTEMMHQCCFFASLQVNAAVEFAMRLPALMVAPAQQAKQIDTSVFARLGLKADIVKKVRGLLPFLPINVWHGVCSTTNLASL